MPASITQSQLLPILGAIVAFLFAALLILYIFRLLFGRRIKAPGPRNRARRLDIVDTFDLDRERQLVIIRRDNTEHLVLIGGPNDVLIEASINRAEGREARPAPPREKDATGPGWPVPPAGAPNQPSPAATQPPTGPIPAPAGEPPKRRPAEPAPAPVAAAQAAAPALQPLPPDLFAPPPKPTPGPTPEPATTRPPAPSRFPTPASPPSRTTGTGFTATPRPPRQAPPPFLSRAQRPTQTGPSEAAAAAPGPAQPPREAPAPAEAAPHEPPKPAPAPPPAPAPQQQPAAASAEPQPPAPAPAESDPLESLEAEMARLLGRPDSKP